MFPVGRLAGSLLLAVCFVLAGCEGVMYFGFVSNPGGSQSVSGMVSAVELNFIHDGMGNTIMFTAVTFINGGTAVTVNFCGDQRSQFPLNRSVRADFKTGVFCSALVSVAIIH